MNLKLKLAIWFAALAAIILAVTFVGIYLRTADFRREEFYSRLEQKARTTQRLLVEVEEIDSVLLRIIDRNTLMTLPEEQILVFDAGNRLIYSTVDEDSILFDYALLADVNRAGEVRRIDPESRTELLGLRLNEGADSYLVIASAYDRFGWRKMTNLRNTLLLSWFLGLALAVCMAYLYVRNIVSRPLIQLTQRVAGIGGDNLKMRLDVPKNQAELTTLAQNFNALLERMEQAFEAQRSFVQFASHELRTPLANMFSETENALAKVRTADEYQAILRSLQEEQSRLISMSNAILLLGQFEKLELKPDTPLIRLDEVLFQTIEEQRALNSDFRILVNFAAVPEDQNELQLQGNSALLRTAIRNLIENACRYSPDQSVQIQIQPEKEMVSLHFQNAGKVLSDAEVRVLFTPFFRGQNAHDKRGFGLGLVIAQRIVRLHRGTLAYAVSTEGLNCFTVRFPTA